MNITAAYLPPMILHRYSIASPSLLHRNDGLDMELIWSNDGVSRRNNDVSVFVCRMDIDGRTQKYDNFLRLIRNRLLVLDAKHDRIC